MHKNYSVQTKVHVVLLPLHQHQKEKVARWNKGVQVIYITVSST